MLFAQATGALSGSEILLIGAVVALIIAYQVGKRNAVWHRARSDYTRVKSSVPGLRSAMWKTFWSLVQVGVFAVLVGAIVLIVMANISGAAVPGR